MSHTIALPAARKASTGWIAVGAITLLYAAMYALNYWLPLPYSNYTTRIWDWSQSALTLAACIVILRYRHRLTLRSSLIGLALGVFSGLSHAMSDPSFWWNVWQGFGTWVCLMAGVALFKEGAVPRISAFEPPLAQIGRSFLVGMVAAIPLAIINNLYFYINSGTFRFENLFSSAFAAVSPGIHEEVIFRFFVLALCLSLLRDSALRRLTLIVAICLAVVPHSLNHLPDLFLVNPAMGFFMLTATSLLFGLPMALLQIRRNLETAITFHWCIDFVRFLFGF